tara:strand:- start:183 stop:503 length:321 start_codon:yes stop_codon:yes gene_type:complete
MKNTMKNFKVCVHENSYMFFSSEELDVPVTNFADALILAVDSMDKQRQYRKSSGTLYARIYGEGLSEHGFPVSEKGKNDKLIELIIKRKKYESTPSERGFNTRYGQ